MSELKGVTRRLHLESIDSKLTCYCTLGRHNGSGIQQLIICANKQGTLEHGLLHCLGLLVTLCLQRGIPEADVIALLRGVEFEPNGATGTKDIPFVKSVADYVARFMEAQTQPKEKPAA